MQKAKGSQFVSKVGFLNLLKLTRLLNSLARLHVAVVPGNRKRQFHVFLYPFKINVGLKKIIAVKKKNENENEKPSKPTQKYKSSIYRNL